VQKVASVEMETSAVLERPMAAQVVLPEIANQAVAVEQALPDQEKMVALE
jgi:hypothetical protein